MMSRTVCDGKSLVVKAMTCARSLRRKTNTVDKTKNPPFHTHGDPAVDELA